MRYEWFKVKTTQNVEPRDIKVKMEAGANKETKAMRLWFRMNGCGQIFVNKGNPS